MSATHRINVQTKKVPLLPTPPQFAPHSQQHSRTTNHTFTPGNSTALAPTPPQPAKLQPEPSSEPLSRAPNPINNLPGTLTPIYHGIYGNSQAKHFPPCILNSNKAYLIKKVYIPRLELEEKLNGLQEIINTTPKLQAVILFTGGNDIDRPDTKGTHEATIIKHFQHIIDTLHKHKIAAFIIPIQERKITNTLKPDTYNALTFHCNIALHNMTKNYGYRVMIQQPREPLQLRKDGVHLTDRDYIIIAKAISNHSHSHLQAAQTYLGVNAPQPNIHKAMAKCSLLSLPARHTTNPTQKPSTP